MTPYEKAEEEYNAITKFRYSIPDAELEEWYLFREADGTNEWGALLYKHHGSYGPGALATNPRALRDLVYDPTSTIELVRVSLQNVFEKLNNIHSKVAQAEVELTDVGGLGRYLRKDRAAARISCVLGSSAALDELQFQGADMIRRLPPE